MITKHRLLILSVWLVFACCQDHEFEDTDDCTPGLCQPGGVCLDQINSTQCRCYSSYTGNKCDQNVHVTCTVWSCLNKGFCLLSEQEEDCHCSIGHSGYICEAKSFPILSQGVRNANRSQFLIPTPANGLMFSCHEQTTCTIPLYFNSTFQGVTFNTIASAGQNTLTCETVMDTTSSRPLPDLGLVKLNVQSNVTGLCYVCVKMMLNNSVSDGVCYVINFKGKTSGQHTGGFSAKAFIPPSPPDNSSVVCFDNRPCHLLFHTVMPIQGVSGCVEVTPSNTSALVFDLSSSKHGCVTDVLFLPQSEEPELLCLRAGQNGERRCYMVYLQNHTKDPCVDDPCDPNGMCINQPYQSVQGFTCLCQDGQARQDCKPLPVTDKNTVIGGCNCSCGSADNRTFLQSGSHDNRTLFLGYRLGVVLGSVLAAPLGLMVGMCAVSLMGKVFKTRCDNDIAFKNKVKPEQSSSPQRILVRSHSRQPAVDDTNDSLRRDNHDVSGVEPKEV